MPAALPGRTWLLATWLVASCGGANVNAPTMTTANPLERIIADIRQADYRADLDGLQRGHDALDAYAADPAVAAPVRYWRGFALWRRAVGLLTRRSADTALIIRELHDAAHELEGIPTGSGLDAEAKSVAASCLMTERYLAGSGSTEATALFEQSGRLLDEAVRAEPDNPRVLWVLGNEKLHTPAGAGGGREPAIAIYQRGLAAARAAARAPHDPLAPTWGEPELLMSLAFAYAQFEPSDARVAEKYARAALALEPDWRFVKEILLPAIIDEKTPPNLSAPAAP